MTLSHWGITNYSMAYASRNKIPLEPIKIKRRVRCKFCKNLIHREYAHKHQNGWVGNCCWDERLRTTE